MINAKTGKEYNVCYSLLHHGCRRTRSKTLKKVYLARFTARVDTQLVDGKKHAMTEQTYLAEVEICSWCNRQLLKKYKQLVTEINKHADEKRDEPNYFMDINIACGGLLFHKCTNVSGGGALRIMSLLEGIAFLYNGIRTTNGSNPVWLKNEGHMLFTKKRGRYKNDKC